MSELWDKVYSRDSKKYDVFGVDVRGCKSNGSYNAETLMKTQFLEVSQ